MPVLTIIAGINGTGKSSIRGVLEGLNINLGVIIDADQLKTQFESTDIKAGKMALEIVNNCIDNKKDFTLETTLSGKIIIKTLKKAKENEYSIKMFYIGLKSEKDSIKRIANRVAEGGHDIPTEDVLRRYNNRFISFENALPYCDEIQFYDNQNGFIKVGEYKNKEFFYTNGCKPKWIQEIQKKFFE